uniref:Uncharacterized protein n=1 Tax=Medicago truncatula TaxID=3880 RepID=A2Q314_MEDTR|nr:hypothetical protein MtrDRAFT_AC154113g9v2 [Medicago truncatula]
MLEAVFIVIFKILWVEQKLLKLCAKFCYGVSINISAYNFVPSFCADKLLQMNESIQKRNFVDSCTLEVVHTYRERLQG